MQNEIEDELITNTINNITEKLSTILLREFLKLPTKSQINLVLIKSAQLLLANILCQIAANKNELEQITNDQGVEIKELTLNCSVTGFSDKFEIIKH